MGHKQENLEATLKLFFKNFKLKMVLKQWDWNYISDKDKAVLDFLPKYNNHAYVSHSEFHGLS